MQSFSVLFCLFRGRRFLLLFLFIHYFTRTDPQSSVIFHCWLFITHIPVPVWTFVIGATLKLYAFIQTVLDIGQRSITQKSSLGICRKKGLALALRSTPNDDVISLHSSLNHSSTLGCYTTSSTNDAASTRPGVSRMHLRWSRLHYWTQLQ